jgi:hypothetical protein
MNLQSAAENEKERRTRSKLEAQREAIFALRRKHWTYRQIAKWLNEHGVSVTFPSVYRFCERAIARRPRNRGSLEIELEKSIFPLNQQTTTTQPPVSKHRFELNI